VIRVVMLPRAWRLALACGGAAVAAAAPLAAGPALAAPAAAQHPAHRSAVSRGGTTAATGMRGETGRSGTAGTAGTVGAAGTADVTARAGATGMGGTAGAGSSAQSAGLVQGPALDIRPAQPVTITITSVNPAIARPRQAVTVTGTVTNGTKSPVSGLAVQLWSSTSPLASRGELASYASGQLMVDSPLPDVAPLAGTLAAGSSRTWTVRAPAATLGLTRFGVYPLAAQVSGSGMPLNAEHTFLPYWPGSMRSAGLAAREQVAWIWPLTAPPERASCPALLDNNLASSFTANGRLGSLLAAGSSPAGTAAGLTWAIDPSLLTSAAVMSNRYQVGGTDTCFGAASHPASAAARSWLARLRSVSQSQDFFITPYADVDVAALTHAGLSSDLTRAYATGRRVAQARLGLGVSQRASGVTGQISWPADGTADYGVLGNLAAHGVSTVIMNSSMMPPASPVGYTPSAVTTTPDGVNAGLQVALADTAITGVLSSPAATGGQHGSAPAAAGVTATLQRFLAETEMIAAEQPSLARSVVITPPRQWDPLPGLASALLQATGQAPWLEPESLASLLTAHNPPGQVARQAPPAQLISRSELRRRLLRKVRTLESLIQTQASMLGRSDGSYLSGAVAAIESSAWRGNPGRVRSLLTRVDAYVDAQFRAVRIIEGGRRDIGQVTLTGRSGPVPVSIMNGLSQPVTVRVSVQASASRITVQSPASTVTIGPHEQRTVAVRVRSSVAGSTMLRLSLLAPDGQPLPGPSAQLIVDATHFGTTALVIIAIAIGVFVISMIARAIRRGTRGNEAGPPADGPGPGPGAASPEAGLIPGAAGVGGPGPAASGTAPDPAAGSAGTAGMSTTGMSTVGMSTVGMSTVGMSTAGPGPSGTGPGRMGTAGRGIGGAGANSADPGGSPAEPDTVVPEPMPDYDTPEEPDEYASAPGRVERPR
jgi:Family of unknown function (DUF6049)